MTEQSWSVSRQIPTHVKVGGVMFGVIAAETVTVWRASVVGARMVALDEPHFIHKKGSLIPHDPARSWLWRHLHRRRRHDVHAIMIEGPVRAKEEDEL